MFPGSTLWKKREAEERAAEDAIPYEQLEKQLTLDEFRTDLQKTDPSAYSYHDWYLQQLYDKRFRRQIEHNNATNTHNRAQDAYVEEKAAKAKNTRTAGRVQKTGGAVSADLVSGDDQYDPSRNAKRRASVRELMGE